MSPQIPSAPAESPTLAVGGGGGGGASSSGRSLRRTQSVWLQAAHYATLRGFVEQHLLQRLLTAITVLEWPLTIARRGTIPLLEQVLYWV